MPIYEYRCTSCGDESEVIHKVGEGARRKCTKCSGRLEKLISRTAFHLKGGGWYDEGYSKGGSTGGSSGKGKSGSQAGKKGGGKSASAKKAASA